MKNYKPEVEHKQPEVKHKQPEVKHKDWLFSILKMFTRSLLWLLAGFSYLIFGSCSSSRFQLQSALQWNQKCQLKAHLITICYLVTALFDYQPSWTSSEQAMQSRQSHRMFLSKFLCQQKRCEKRKTFCRKTFSFITVWVVCRYGLVQASGFSVHNRLYHSKHRWICRCFNYRDRVRLVVRTVD